MNLPAGAAGSIVSVVDYTNTFQTNNKKSTSTFIKKLNLQRYRETKINTAYRDKKKLHP